MSDNFNPKQLDFIICNAGAYIMCLNSNGDWVSDEAWDHKVTVHWDKQLVLRTLTRMTMNRAQKISSEAVRSE